MDNNNNNNNQQAIIRELTDIQGLQLYPEMYIGNTEYCTHLINECISNARDECFAGHSNRIDVSSIYDDNNNEWYVIRDFGGLGIPLTSPEIEGDVIIRICTKLHSGGKFHDRQSLDNKNDYYNNFSSGQFGVGLVAVNALSSKLYITTRANDKDNNHWRYYFENSQFVEKKLIHLKSNNPNNIYATEIKFLPNKKYFQNAKWNKEVIENILSVARYGLDDNIQINFEGVPVENTFLEKYFQNNIQLINELYINPKSKEECQIYIGLYEDFDSGKEFKGIVNLLATDTGTHYNLCFNLLKNKLFEIAEKNKKHVQINDLLIPIKILCKLKIQKPQFDGQIKDKLDVRYDDLKLLIEPVIDNLIKNNKDFFNNVINLAEIYRINLQSSKESKKSKVGRTVIVSGLRDCSSKDKKLRSLYFVEGNSAAGASIKARNVEIDAIMALRGKVLNVLDKPKSKILQNDVIKNIANALGYKLYGEIDPEKCRYGRMFILADSDPDGRHIECLLTFIFYMLFPELVKAGMVYTILCPLYGCTINKKFIPIYDNNTRQEYNNKGVLTHHYKGLSEMNPSELAVCAFDPEYRKCNRLKYSDFDLIKLWKDSIGNLRYEA